MKRIIVEVKDDTKTSVVEPILINHLSDLGEGVKTVVDDFVKANAGAVIPPVSIKAVEPRETRASE